MHIGSRARHRNAQLPKRWIVKQKEANLLPELDEHACWAMDQQYPTVQQLLTLFGRHRVAEETEISLIVKAGRRQGLEDFATDAAPLTANASWPHDVPRAPWHDGVLDISEQLDSELAAPSGRCADFTTDEDGDPPHSLAKRSEGMAQGDPGASAQRAGPSGLDGRLQDAEAITQAARQPFPEVAWLCPDETDVAKPYPSASSGGVQGDPGAQARRAGASNPHRAETAPRGTSWRPTLRQHSAADSSRRSTPKAAGPEHYFIGRIGAPSEPVHAVHEQGHPDAQREAPLPMLPAARYAVVSADSARPAPGAGTSERVIPFHACTVGGDHGRALDLDIDLKQIHDEQPEAQEAHRAAPPGGLAAIAPVWPPAELVKVHRAAPPGGLAALERNLQPPKNPDANCSTGEPAATRYATISKDKTLLPLPALHGPGS